VVGDAGDDVGEPGFRIDAVESRGLDSRVNGDRPPAIGSIPSAGVAPPIDDIDFGGLIADTAFDANAVSAEFDERGATVVTSQHPLRACPRESDADMDKWRYRIESFICKLKEFKPIAMRSDKTDQSFSAMLHLAAAIQSR
jgi:hypothetical protein